MFVLGVLRSSVVTSGGGGVSELTPFPANHHPASPDLLLYGEWGGWGVGGGEYYSLSETSTYCTAGWQVGMEVNRLLELLNCLLQKLAVKRLGQGRLHKTP